MNKGQIDIILPTTGKRLNGLRYQIDAILNQSYDNIRLWVLIDHDEPKCILDALNAHETEIGFTFPKDKKGMARFIRVPQEWRGNWGHKPIRYALEKLPLEGEWQWTIGDDDCLLEWGMMELIKSSDGVDVVVGLCLPVKRDYQYVPMPLGNEIRLGLITGSCCLYKREKVMQVGYDDSKYEADWILIKRLLRELVVPYRQINSVISVMPQSF